jgi:hypothetical protein
MQGDADGTAALFAIGSAAKNAWLHARL